LKKIAVIGSGFAGLSSAIELAALGHDVTVFEKNSQAGGRARKLEIDGFTFDMGPSWYWMPDVFEKFFARHGKKPEDYYSLKKLDPGFSIVYDKDEVLVVPASFNELIEKFETIESGSGEKLKKFMRKAAIKYESICRRFVGKRADFARIGSGRSSFEYACSWKKIPTYHGI